MRPEDLQVNLRPRSPWEAMELGTALLRRHAAAVWRPWLLAMLASLAVAAAAALLLGRPWLALLLCWWLKPVVERVPLYVLSRAVFGAVPGTWDTLRAQPRFAPATLPATLLWRRFGPARALLVPADVLEGNTRARRAERRRVVAGPAYAQAGVLSAISLAFEFALALGCVALLLILVPPELFKGLLATLRLELSWPLPAWTWIAAAIVLWMGALVIGPFYVAAGFGMYLNRRSESEAWDVELAFRRLRRRVLAHAGPLLLALVLVLPQAARAGDLPPDDKQQKGAEAEDAPRPDTLPGVFGEALVDDAAFRRAAAEAYRDPLLNRERTRVRWEPRRKFEFGKLPELPQLPRWLAGLASVIPLLAESGLWLLLGVLVLLLLVTARRWWPWLAARAPVRTRRRAARVELEAATPPPPLPEDVPAAVRRLWADGQPRAALALLYRASVVAMAGRARVELPPGATEAQCLRAAAALEAEAGRDVFVRTVRTWQYAAYAGRLPADPALDALLDEATRTWGWRP